MTKAEEKAETIAEAVEAAARAVALASRHPDPDAFVAAAVSAHDCGIAYPEEGDTKGGEDESEGGAKD